MHAAGTLTIRPADETDLPAIVAILNAAIATRTATAQLDPVDVDDRRAWLDAHDARHPVWAALDEDGLAGWLSVLPWSDPAALPVRRDVDAEFGGAGVGRALGPGQHAEPAGESVLVERRPHGMARVVGVEPRAAVVHVDRIELRRRGAGRDRGVEDRADRRQIGRVGGADRQGPGGVHGVSCPLWAPVPPAIRSIVDGAHAPLVPF